MPKRHYSKAILGRIDTLMGDEVAMKDGWAARFLPSIREQFTRKGSITASQFQHLEKLEEKFSDENKKKLAEQEAERLRLKAEAEEEWSKEYFGTELEEDGRVIAQYYKEVNEVERQNWYETTYTAVLAGELPSKKGYKRMMENDFARRVMKAWKSEPEFPKGSLVQPRKKVKESRNHPLYGVEFAFVMKLNVQTPTPVAGGKKYLVLPKGNFKAIVCEERELKGFKNKK